MSALPDRADNFLVGLTNNPPNTMPPTTNGYATCGQWPGSAPASATMFVRCVDTLPPARYVVIIQQYQPRGYLQICELEVYGKGKTFRVIYPFHWDCVDLVLFQVHDRQPCAIELLK